MEIDGEGCYQKVTEPKYECLLFDVDDTLYPSNSGISVECTKNIIDYMINKLGMEEEKVPEICSQLYKDYGTTMAGLAAIGYDFDYDDFHSSVHGRLPYELLQPDHTLRNLLHSLPLRKVIFSNGDEAHVAKVLSRLGVEDCFDDIVCFETLNAPAEEIDEHGTNRPTPIVCKPFEDAFEQAFKIAGINPQKTLFFDDSLRNLQTAKSLGLDSVWVGWSHRTPEGEGDSLAMGVDYTLDSIHNMREALPELWQAAGADKPEVSYSGNPANAIETVVNA